MAEPTNGLVEFLHARLDEDKRAAQFAKDAAEKRTHYRRTLTEQADRELREVNAKRCLLDLHHAELVETINADRDERSGYRCQECDSDEYPCTTLRLIAAVYAEHPNYQAKWKPKVA